MRIKNLTNKEYKKELYLDTYDWYYEFAWSKNKNLIVNLVGQFTFTILQT